MSKGKRRSPLEEALKNSQNIRNQFKVNANRTGDPWICAEEHLTTLRERVSRKSGHESGLVSQRLFDFIFDDGLDYFRHTKPQHRQIREERQHGHWLSAIFTVNRKAYEDGNKIEKQIRREEENIGNNTIGLFIH